MPPDDPRSDHDLVAAANRGDELAMEAIYLRYRDWALRLSWRFTRDHDLAMDVVQEAFMYLFGKFAGRGGLILQAKLTTLLYPAIKNSALAARRKMRPLTMDLSSGGMSEPDVLPLEDLPASDEMRMQLALILRQMSDAHREVLLMKIVDGMEHGEIALALGIPEGTVKSRLHHALAAVRQAMARDSHKYFL